MKKSTFVVALVLVLALCVPAVAFAALAPSSPLTGESCPAAATCPNYADRNGNNACDRYENGACPGYADADGDGVCDNYVAPRPDGNAARGNDADAAVDDAAVVEDAASESPAPEAAQEAPAPEAAPRGGGRGYVDADSDGVCDNYQGGACSGYVDADGDGVCDNCAGAGANCPGYADADGDGVCDNYGNGRSGNGNGRGYVDADSDGVCDNYGNGGGQGQGRHHGGGRGCAR